MRLISCGLSYRRPLFYIVLGLFWGWPFMSVAAPKRITLDVPCSRFDVILPANPSTGFRWTIESYDTERFAYLETEYVAATTAQIGTPGTRIFYFKPKVEAMCPESTTLRFSYGRSWEPDSSTLTEVVVHFGPPKQEKN